MKVQVLHIEGRPNTADAERVRAPHQTRWVSRMCLSSRYRSTPMPKLRTSKPEALPRFASGAAGTVPTHSTF